MHMHNQFSYKNVEQKVVPIYALTEIHNIESYRKYTGCSRNNAIILQSTGWALGSTAEDV